MRLSHVGRFRSTSTWLEPHVQRISHTICVEPFDVIAIDTLYISHPGVEQRLMGMDNFNYSVSHLTFQCNKPDQAVSATVVEEHDKVF